MVLARRPLPQDTTERYGIFLPYLSLRAMNARANTDVTACFHSLEARSMVRTRRRRKASFFSLREHIVVSLLNPVLPDC